MVAAALEALLKLVAHEGDGKTISLADLITLKLEEAGVHKTFSINKEKRFTRLGYQAGALYDCITYCRQILNDIPLNNLLIRACQLYLEDDFIIADFKALANFTYNVTMPFLNFVEKTNQDCLIELLPKLWLTWQIEKLTRFPHIKLNGHTFTLSRMVQRANLIITC